MKLYCGCISPTERRKSACEDEDEEAQGLPALFWGLADAMLPSGLQNGGRNDRLEQPNGTKQTTGERPLDGRVFNVVLGIKL